MVAELRLPYALTVASLLSWAIPVTYRTALLIESRADDHKHIKPCATDCQAAVHLLRREPNETFVV